MDTLLKDPDLAPEGLRKIDFAASRMPVLGAVAAELARTRPLAGQRIAACLHVTTETANLCRALVAGGAELALCASNALSTKDDVAAAIHAELGAAVFAVHGADRDTFHRQVDGVLATRPTLVVDDGADLTATVHTRRRDLLAGIAGATEVTTIGVVRARNMAREGVLAYPLLAVNDAPPSTCSTTATAPASPPWTASCGPPTSCWPARCSWSSATAGAAAGWRRGPGAWEPGWWCARSTP